MNDSKSIKISRDETKKTLSCDLSPNDEYLSIL